MLTGGLKIINSKYFKQIAKNTKDFAQNQQLPIYHGLQTIPSENYLKLYSFHNKFIDIEPKQPAILHQIFYPTVDTEIQSRLHVLQSSYPISNFILIEEIVTKIDKKLVKAQIQRTQTLQFQANSPIQDKIVCKQLQTINAICMSVFDGHGGSMLAEFASKKINEFIDCYLAINLTQSIKSSPQQTINVIKNSINQAYDRIQTQFFQILQNQVKTGNKQIAKIGSCAITCVIYQNTIIVANCGDSQGLIIKENHQGLTCFATNQQLNTSNANQINRIRGDFKNIDDQVFIKSKTNGKLYIKGVLQPTRTLGDYYLKNEKYFQKLKISRQSFKGPYLTHKPDFHIIPIQQNFKHLILASDGLWDFASKKQIIKVIDQYSKFNPNQLIKETNDEISQEMTELDLNQTYIEKVYIKTESQKKLAQMLRDVVLDKCAKKKGKTIQGLMNVKTGERRSYCDDISIITVNFKKTHK